MQLSYTQVVEAVRDYKKAVLNTVRITKESPPKTGETIQLALIADAIANLIKSHGRSCNIDGLDITMTTYAGSYYGFHSSNMPAVADLFSKLRQDVFSNFDNDIAMAIIGGTAADQPRGNRPKKFTGFE